MVRSAAASTLALLPISILAACGLATSGSAESGSTTTTGSATTATATTGDVTVSVTGTGAGGGGVGGTTTTVTTGAGGTGGVEGENCANGIDDDADGDEDCVDADCAMAGFHCVKDDPDVAEYVIRSSMPGCPPGYMQRVFYDCGQCACTTTLGSCDVSIQIFENGDCNMGALKVTATFTADLGNDFCSNTEPDVNEINGGADVGVIATITSNNDGACTFANPPIYLCVAPGAGTCAAADEVCVPAGAVNCVIKSDPGTCAGDYDKADLVIHPETGADSCGCGCAKDFEVCTGVGHTDDTCGGGAVSFVANGNCDDTDASDIDSVSAVSDVQCSNGSPSPQGMAKMLCCL